MKSIFPSFISMENPNIDFEQKVIVCLIDNIVVANISNFKIQGDNMLAFLPTWELLLKIVQSPNHKFIEHTSWIVEGSIWNGEEFIARVIEETVVNEEITTNNEDTIQ
jgi:hypothetical protein